MRSGVGTGHGSVPLLGFFFSEAETKALTMERAQGHWKDLNESLSDLCKQRTEGHWKAEVGGKGVSGQRRASFQEMMNCIFHGDNGIRDLVGCHIQLSLLAQETYLSPNKRNTVC